jgi:adenylate cyclase
MEDGVERRLTTILAADIVGYSRLMAADEAGTQARLMTLRKELIEPRTEAHHGRVVKFMGDGILIEFGSVVDAVNFAIGFQRSMIDRNQQTPESMQVVYRIGINIGDVIVEGDDLSGNGVIVASRLEGQAEPGSISISRTVLDHVEGKVEANFEDLGALELKNIPTPIQTFRVLPVSPSFQNASGAKLTAKRKLHWPILAGGIIAAGLLAAIVVWQQPMKPAVPPASIEAMAFPLPDKPSIAVLPFTNISGDVAHEYFADGMAEDLITDLSKLSGLFVVARNSSFSYKGQAVQVRQVAEELGVRYILEGSVRRAGEQVRINAQLIDATTGGHIWAERYDGPIRDVFALQDDITREIIEALSITLTGEELAQQNRLGTENAAAHDAYLQGLAHYKLLTPEELAKAVLFLEEAVQLDPDYAQAHAALASAYWDAFKNDWALDLGLASFQAEERANTHLEEALKSPIPLAHALKARIMASLGLYDLAVSEAEKAVELDQNDATAHAGLAAALIKAGRPSDAFGPIRQAMRLDPHQPPSYLITLGAAQFGMEQFDEAAVTFERAVGRNPDNEIPLIYLASSYGHLGRMVEAEATIHAANDVRAKLGMGDLTLERIIPTGLSPFGGEIDFSRFGGDNAQKRLRLGLSMIPALTWQYLIETHLALGPGETRYKIREATEIDLQTAKSFYDRGVLFIDTGPSQGWRESHIPNSVNLPMVRERAGPTKQRLTQTTLGAIADETDEIVILWCKPLQSCTPWAAAKAIKWGYQKVHYFSGGVPAWKAAGYPTETGE